MSTPLVPHIALPLASTPTHILLMTSVLQSRFWRYPLAVTQLSLSVLVAVPSVGSKNASAPLIVPAHPGDLGNSVVLGNMRVDAHTAPIPVIRRSGRRESFCIVVGYASIIDISPIPASRFIFFF